MDHKATSVRKAQCSVIDTLMSCHAEPKGKASGLSKKDSSTMLSAIQQRAASSELAALFVFLEIMLCDFRCRSEKVARFVRKFSP